MNIKLNKKKIIYFSIILVSILVLLLCVYLFLLRPYLEGTKLTFYKKGIIDTINTIAQTINEYGEAKINIGNKIIICK